MGVPSSAFSATEILTTGVSNSGALSLTSPMVMLTCARHQNDRERVKCCSLDRSRASRASIMGPEWLPRNRRRKRKRRTKIERNASISYLTVAERRWFARHGGHVEQHERMVLMVQFGVGPDHSRHRVDGKVSVGVARIDRVANAVRIRRCTATAAAAGGEKPSSNNANARSN